MKCFKCLDCPSAQVPECLSVLRVFEWLSCQVLQRPECRSGQVHQVHECFSALSSQVLLKCFWKDLGVPKCSWSALWVPKCSLNALQIKRVSNITGNELHNSFIEHFKKSLQYVFYITLIVFCFLRNKMCKFFHFLLDIIIQTKLTVSKSHRVLLM